MQDTVLYLSVRTAHLTILRAAAQRWWEHSFLSMPKTYKAYVYDNRKLSKGKMTVTTDTDVVALVEDQDRPKLVQHVTGETYIYYRGTAKRVVLDAEGKIVGEPAKLTKKQRRKVRAELKAKEGKA